MNLLPSPMHAHHRLKTCSESMSRRAVLAAIGGGWWLSGSAWGAATSAHPASSSALDEDWPVLDRTQSKVFRDWMTLLIHTQLQRGPSPRWTHRDCAGLVRFAASEALRSHDLDWKKANGLLTARVPPDVALTDQQRQAMRHAWRRVDGSRHAFVGALELIQENTVYSSRLVSQAAPADLLFYDFGDDQHLMVWMGRYIAYHTGRASTQDNGLRAMRVEQLMQWQDTRWRPSSDNPNFSGIYRFAFLSKS